MDSNSSPIDESLRSHIRNSNRAFFGAITLKAANKTEASGWCSIMASFSVKDCSSRNGDRASFSRR